MPFLSFDMRRLSRNGTTSSKERYAQQPQAPPIPSSLVISTASRQPLVPQTNLTLSSSQTSLLSETPSMASSSMNGSMKPGRRQEGDSHFSKATPSHNTRSERSNESSYNQDCTYANMPTGAPASPQRSTYTNHQDLYTHNALHSFSFGAASNAAPPTRAIDPLSPVHDDDSDESPYQADTTPRPSLVPSSPRSHSSQLPSIQSQFVPASLPPPPRRSPAKTAEHVRKTSASATHAFASSSTSSLSSAAMNFSADSQRGGSSPSPQTSANELTSEDEAEEHRHPILPCPPNHSFHHADKLSLYGSDDEALDDDFADGYEPDIEISSVVNDDHGQPPDFHNFDNPSRESFQPSFAPRRGSLAVPIPSPNSIGGRDREDSIATLRRPSRSLEGLRSDRSDAEGLGFADCHRMGPSPTSVPQSESDWRDIRRRSKDPASPTTAPGTTLSSQTFLGSGNPQSVTSSSTVVHNSVLDGFDSTWLNIDPTTGIVNLEWDQSEMQDIVSGFQGPPTSNRPYRRSSSSTTGSGRRLSTTSTNSDPFFRGLNKWGGQQYLDEKQKWTFMREKADRLEEHKVLERERNSIANLFQHKPSHNSASSSAGSSAAAFHDYNHSKDGKTNAKDVVKDPLPWRGMALGAEEWWQSYTNGRYRVVRQNQPNHDPAKPFQQRLNVSHHRTPYSMKPDNADGPTSTIHKHSKANGFSISRHYRMRRKHPAVPSTNGRGLTSAPGTDTPSSEREQQQKPSHMVLLAPRRVQEQYTSTNTTLKLEAHGLLSENGRHGPKDLERLAIIEKEKKERRKREKEQEKKRLKEMKKAEAGKSKDKGKSKSKGSIPASSSESSAGSVLSDTSSCSKPGPPPGPLNSARPSVDHSVMSADTVGSDRTVKWSRKLSANLNHDFNDDDDFADLDDSVPRRRPPSRTPHTEVYSPLPAEALESFQQQESHSQRFFGLRKLKNTAASPFVERAYIPPWPVSFTRAHVQTNGIVEDLNSSFREVGLLPIVDEVKGSGHSSRRKKQEQRESNHGKGNSQEKFNVFHSFSSDYLYMLLPLWPGETDYLSAKTYPYRAPNVPIETRKYLLIYYSPDGVSTDGDRGKNGALENVKKQQRSRSSPTSSRESANILLEKFHFCARIVSYADIQGSGVRSPDMGLSVLGPLQEAVETMPTHSYIDTFQVIGLCTSREKGIEFVPDGLEKLGLARRVPDPQLARDEHEPPVKRFSITGVEEADDISDTMLILTPVGRAVVEMAWLGAMAVTSFAPPM